MLDENLPCFFIKPSDDDRTNTVYLSQHGAELKPEYTMRKPDTNTPAAKNCYAIALYDSYNPEVLYAEVIVHPEWTQPTLSQAEIRAQQQNGGISAPPVPIVPTSFTIQLYNPDQQVVVKKIEGTWNTSAYWEFAMPMHTFRQPSASALDRSLNDPHVEATTPKVAFKWKKDGKLTRDLTCFLAGKSTDGKKSREPDITVAMFKGGKEVTVYEPNMSRVDVEDSKGLEVVLILSARVIKDIFFNANREMFNISSPPTAGTKRKNSGPVIKGTSSTSPPAVTIAPPPSAPVPHSQIPQSPSEKHPAKSSRPPPADPRTQWEIDAETARLKAIVENEQRERDKADKLEQERIKKMLEEEEKERRRREAEVDRETERLRKQFGVTAIDDSAGRHVRFNNIPPPPPRQSGQGQRLSQNHSAPHSRPVPVPRPQSTPVHKPTASSSPTHCPTINGWLHGPSAPAGPSQPQPQASSSKPSKTHKSNKSSGPYMQIPGAPNFASLSGFFGGGQRERDERSGLFGLGGSSEDRRKVSKKRSVQF